MASYMGPGGRPHDMAAYESLPVNYQHHPPANSYQVVDQARLATELRYHIGRLEAELAHEQSKRQAAELTNRYLLTELASRCHNPGEDDKQSQSQLATLRTENDVLKRQLIKAKERYRSVKAKHRHIAIATGNACFAKLVSTLVQEGCSAPEILKQDICHDLLGLLDNDIERTNINASWNATFISDKDNFFPTNPNSSSPTAIPLSQGFVSRSSECSTSATSSTLHISVGAREQPCHEPSASPSPSLGKPYKNKTPNHSEAKAGNDDEWIRSSLRSIFESGTSESPKLQGPKAPKAGYIHYFDAKSSPSDHENPTSGTSVRSKAAPRALIARNSGDVGQSSQIQSLQGANPTTNASQDSKETFEADVVKSLSKKSKNPVSNEAVGTLREHKLGLMTSTCASEKNVPTESTAGRSLKSYDDLTFTQGLIPTGPRYHHRQNQFGARSGDDVFAPSIKQREASKDTRPTITGTANRGTHSLIHNRYFQAHPSDQPVYRTVIIDKLPIGITLPEVMKCIQRGAVVFSQLLDTSSISQAMTVMLVFLFDWAAAKFTQASKVYPLVFRGMTARVTLLHTPTTTRLGLGTVNASQPHETRCILLHNVPANLNPPDFRKQLGAMEPHVLAPEVKRSWLISLSKHGNNVRMVFSTIAAARNAREMFMRLPVFKNSAIVFNRGSEDGFGPSPSAVTKGNSVDDVETLPDSSIHPRSPSKDGGYRPGRDRAIVSGPKICAEADAKREGRPQDVNLIDLNSTEDVKIGLQTKEMDRKSQKADSVFEVCDGKEQEDIANHDLSKAPQDVFAIEQQPLFKASAEPGRPLSIGRLTPYEEPTLEHPQVDTDHSPVAFFPGNPGSNNQDSPDAKGSASVELLLERALHSCDEQLVALAERSLMQLGVADADCTAQNGPVTTPYPAHKGDTTDQNAITRLTSPEQPSKPFPAEDKAQTLVDLDNKNTTSRLPLLMSPVAQELRSISQEVPMWELY